MTQDILQDIVLGSFALFVICIFIFGSEIANILDAIAERIRGKK